MNISHQPSISHPNLAYISSPISLPQEIDKKEVVGVPINSLCLHPTRRRLLMQLRNHTLLTLDTRMLHFSARFGRMSLAHLRGMLAPPLCSLPL